MFGANLNQVIEGTSRLQSEIIVPEEFPYKSTKSVSNVIDEISKLYKLYQDGIISKEEFDTQKKKLLAQ